MALLENIQIRLRALEPEDIEVLCAWENDESIWQVSNTLVPFSKYVLAKYLENSHLDIYSVKQLRLVIEHKDTKVQVGLIDLFDFDPYHQRAGVGIFIAKEYRGKRYASEAISSFVKYAFETLALHQLYCNIGTDNMASLELFKKQGFEIIGEKKDWNKTPSGFQGEYLLQRIKL